jgi:hypothetical protein
MSNTEPVFVDGRNPDGPIRRGHSRVYHKKSRTGCMRCRSRRVRVRLTSTFSEPIANPSVNRFILDSAMKRNPSATTVSDRVFAAFMTVMILRPGAAPSPSRLPQSLRVSQWRTSLRSPLCASRNQNTRTLPLPGHGTRIVMKIAKGKLPRIAAASPWSRDNGAC